MGTKNNTQKKETNNRISLHVTADLSVNVMPNECHEFLMTTKEVANGYGVSIKTIGTHKMEHPLELIEGKHFITATGNPSSDLKAWRKQLNDLGLPHNATLWTKRGIVRLGFFIKSEHARMFRDWAEDLIIHLDEQRNLFGEVIPQPKELPNAKRYHNFITRDRLLDIMADVCQIEDKTLRVRLSNKLNNIK